RFLHDPGPEVRRIARQPGRGAPGEAGDRQVEAAPKEMHRANLAEKLPSESGEDPIHLDQDPPELRHVFRVVGGVRSVMLEGDGIGYLDRHGPDPGFQPKSAETAHNLRVEIRDSARAERDRLDLAFARLERQGVTNEIEVD